MVFLTVKGTKYKDEFTVERTLADEMESVRDDDGTTVVKAGVALEVCRIQNQRHQAHLMLLSARELSDEWAINKSSVPEEMTALRTEYVDFVEKTTARMKEARVPVGLDDYATVQTELRRLTTAIYPDLCSHADGPAAAVEQLYAMYENPELSEEKRLTVYHCRVIMDTTWRSNELQPEDSVALWFGGRKMEGNIGTYAGRNEKSRLTVKVAPSSGPAPSGEPSMDYDAQRALYAHMRERRETYKKLEDSELRDRVVQQARGAVVLPGGAGLGNRGGVASVPEPAIQTTNIRRICPTTEERIVDSS